MYTGVQKVYTVPPVLGKPRIRVDLDPNCVRRFGEGTGEVSSLEILLSITSLLPMAKICVPELLR